MTFQWTDLFEKEIENAIQKQGQVERTIRYLRGLDRPKGQRPGVQHILKEFQWLRIDRVGYLLPDSYTRLANHTALHGLYHLDRSCAYLLIHDTSSTSIYWGIEGSVSKPLQVALNTAWPELICSPATPKLPFSQQQVASFAYSGIPAQSDTMSSSARWNAIDSLLRGVQETDDPWLWLLIFQPVVMSQIQKWCIHISNIVGHFTARYLQPGSKSEDSRLAKDCIQLLEDYLSLFEHGLAEGGWMVYGLAITASGSAVSLQAALSASFSGQKSRPEPWHLRPAGQEVEQMDWRHQLTFLPSGLLSLMVNLPRQEHPGIEVGTVTRFDLKPPCEVSPHRPHIPLGVVLDGKYRTRQQFSIDLDVLNRHLFVTGITGSGKTTTVQTLLSAAVRHNVRILVIEPVKREYRKLLLPAMRVFAIGDPDCALKLNPFVFEGVSCSTHIDHLKALFAAAYVLYAPMPYILEQALNEVYLDRGWDLTSGCCWRAPNGHPRAWPTLTDLYHKVGQVIARSGYGPRLEPEIRAALEVRVNNLRLGAKGLLLDTPGSVSLDELVSQPTVLELQGIGDAEQRAFLLGLLLTKIYEGCIAWGSSDSLRLLVVIEEAHRLLEERSSSASEDFANPQGKAIQSFADILAEMRAYGVGLIIAEQSPTRITRQVIKNTATKIAHQLVDADDWRLMSDAMALQENEGRSIVTLPKGQALIFSIGMDRPLRVQIQASIPTKPSQTLLSSGTLVDTRNVQTQAISHRLLDDKRLWESTTKLVASWLLEDSTQLQESWHTWLNSLSLATPTIHRHLTKDLSKNIGGQLLDGIARMIGNLFGWSCEEEAAAADWLKQALDKSIEKDGDIDDILDLLREWWYNHLKIDPPFKGPVCEEECPHPCRYRMFVILDGECQMRFVDKSLYKNDSEVETDIEAALLRITPLNPVAKEQLTRCLAIHYAQWLEKPLVSHQRFVNQIIERLGYGERNSHP
jgi:hypothetical protein